MNNQRKTLKRIFTLFVAILCTFGVFFVSYITTFATSFSVKIDYHFGYAESSLYSKRYLAPLDSMDSLISTVDTFVTVDLSLGVTYQLKATYRRVSGGSAYYYSSRWFFNNTELSYNSSSPTVIDCSSFSSLTFIADSSYVSSERTYYVTFVNLPTPTPEPTTTPGPTPTPGIDPGPALPTVPPGEQSYENFFARMAADAQNAFNALFASWQNANNGFYTSIFYIGIPVFIGIFGLVAYIVFGGDNDD